MTLKIFYFNMVYPPFASDNFISIVMFADYIGMIFNRLNSESNSQNFGNFDSIEIAILSPSGSIGSFFK